MKMQLFFASMALLVLTFVGFGQTVDGDMSNDGGDNKANPIAAKVFQAAGRMWLRFRVR